MNEITFGMFDYVPMKVFYRWRARIFMSVFGLYVYSRRAVKVERNLADVLFTFPSIRFFNYGFAVGMQVINHQNQIVGRVRFENTIPVKPGDILNTTYRFYVHNQAAHAF